MWAVVSNHARPRTPCVSVGPVTPKVDQSGTTPASAAWWRRSARNAVVARSASSYGNGNEAVKVADSTMSGGGGFVSGA